MGGRIVTSSYIRSETERTLHAKHQWDTFKVRQIMNGFVRGSPDVYVPGQLNGVCRDPKDDQILECAVVAQAHVLVTGDNDLLVHDPYEGLRIMKAREYCNYMAALRLEE